MVQAIVDVTKHTNQVLNIVKAKYGLQTKSDAINLVVTQYEEEVLEPALRPEYLSKLSRIGKESAVAVKDFGRRYGLEDVRA